MFLKRKHLLVAMFLVAITAQAGTISGKVSGANAETVVWIDNPSGKTEVPSKPFVVDQKSLLFIPHVTVVPVGSTVEFLNSDNVQHNVFWAAIGGNKKLGKNLGTWPKAEKRSFKFENPGVVSVLCNVHPEMSAYLVVVPTSFYATTNSSGEYTIENVPDGSHTITVWHEGMKQLLGIAVKSGATKADFSLSK
jgi:plastocyanin